MADLQSEALANLALMLDLCVNEVSTDALYGLKESADRVRQFDPLAAETSWFKGLGAVLEYGDDAAMVVANRLFDDEIERLLMNASLVRDSSELVDTLRDLFDKTVLLEAFVEQGNETRVDDHRFTSLLEMAGRLGVQCDGRALRHALAAQVNDARWTQDVSTVRRAFKGHLPVEVAAVWVEDGSAWLSFPSFSALAEALRAYIPEDESESLIDQLSITLNDRAEVDWSPEDIPFICDELRLIVHRPNGGQGVMFSMQGDNGLGDMRHFATFLSRYEDLIYRDSPTVDLYVGPSVAVLERMQRKTAVERYVLTPIPEGLDVTWPVSLEVDLPRIADAVAELIAGDRSKATGEIVDADSSQMIAEPAEMGSPISLTKVASWQVPLSGDVGSAMTSLELVKVRVRVPYGSDPQMTARLATALGVATSQRYIKFDHLSAPGWKVDLRRGATIEQVGPVDELTWTRFWRPGNPQATFESIGDVIDPSASITSSRTSPGLETP